MSPAHITHGYLTKYKMLQLGVTSVVDDLGPVPVACHLFDGNRNGHAGVAQQYHLLRQFLGLPENFLLVSDRGTCSAEHLARLLRHNHHAICAGQWQDYRRLFDQHAADLVWTKASFLAREQQRRRDDHSSLPLEEYRLAVVAHQLVDPLTKNPFDCRVIFVHSSAAAKEAKERREQNVARIKDGLDKLARKLERAHPCTTAATITKEIERLLGNKAAARHFTWQLVPLTDAERAALPPPQKGRPAAAPKGPAPPDASPGIRLRRSLRPGRESPRRHPGAGDHRSADLERRRAVHRVQTANLCRTWPPRAEDAAGGDADLFENAEPHRSPGQPAVRGLASDHDT